VVRACWEETGASLLPRSISTFLHPSSLPRNPVFRLEWEWYLGRLLLPFLYSISDTLHALPFPAEGVDGFDVRGEDVVEAGEVFGVEGEAVEGYGVLDGEDVEGVEADHCGESRWGMGWEV